MHGITEEEERADGEQRTRESAVGEGVHTMPPPYSCAPKPRVGGGGGATGGEGVLSFFPTEQAGAKGFHRLMHRKHTHTHTHGNEATEGRDTSPGRPTGQTSTPAGAAWACRH